MEFHVARLLQRAIIIKHIFGLSVLNVGNNFPRTGEIISISNWQGRMRKI